MDSGLYERLSSQGQLVEHRGVKTPVGVAGAHKVIEPKVVPFISYPYEWSFSQLKDAALLTLAVQKEAISLGQSLKDASAYNVQFASGRPQLIDTLSFEKYDGGRVWTAYRQFCQHFLAPLALMSYVDPALGLLLRDYIDGVPLPLASKLLPGRAKLRGGVLMHLVLHGSAQQKHANDAKPVAQPAMTGGVGNQRAVLGVIESLERTVRRLRLPSRLKTEWGSYYEFTNYTDDAFKHKSELVAELVKQAAQSNVWDLGGNDGTFTRAALKNATAAICFDVDPIAVEKNYLRVRHDKTRNLLPLVLDLTNPSPGLGWAGSERQSLRDRAQIGTTVLALALIHHLAIGDNLPFGHIAEYFAALGEYLVIEFVPKADSKVQILLATREDIFDDYDKAGFERAFGKWYTIQRAVPVKGSERTLYLMKRKQS